MLEGGRIADIAPTAVLRAGRKIQTESTGQAGSAKINLRHTTEFDGCGAVGGIVVCDGRLACGGRLREGFWRMDRSDPAIAAPLDGFDEDGLSAESLKVRRRMTALLMPCSKSKDVSQSAGGILAADHFSRTSQQESEHAVADPVDGLTPLRSSPARSGFENAEAHRGGRYWTRTHKRMFAGNLSLALAMNGRKWHFQAYPGHSVPDYEST